MSLRTVIYLRKSSKDEDEKQIHSIPRQKEDILEFIERYNNAQVPEERLTFDPEKDIIAEDASGKTLGRVKFAKMVQEIQKKKYDVLLCTELSRLSRNAVDTGTVVQLLEPIRPKELPPLKRIQTKDKIFTTTPTDKFTLALFLTVSKFENDQRAMNTQSGMAHQKGKGRTTHRAPLGYINKGEKKGETWVEPDPETFENVRKLWEFFMTGDYSVRDLKREGDARGVTIVNKKGERHLPVESSYRVILRNRYYAGYVKKVDRETKKIEWIPAKHRALVSDAEFEKVQLILQGRGWKHQATSNAPTIDALLNELLVCGKCQTEIGGAMRPTRMVFEDKVRYTCTHCKHRFASADKSPCPKCGTSISHETKVDTYRYYRCARKLSSLSCSHDFYGTGKPAKNVQAEKIEEYFDKQLSRLHISDGLFQVLKRQLYTLWLEGNQHLKKQKEIHRKQLAKLEEERLKIQRKALDKERMSDIEREDHESLLEANRSDQEEKEQEIAQLKETGEEKFEKAWQTLNALREAKTVFGEPSIGFEPKRKLVLSLVSNLKITDNKWEIIWKKPFDTVAKASFAKKAGAKSGTGSDAEKLNWLPELGSNQ